MRGKRLLGAVLLFVISLVLGGCWDRDEPEELGFVLATAFDRGENEEFLVTVAVAVPSNTPAAQGGGGGGKGQAVVVEAAEADSIFAALQELNSRLSRRLVHYHNKVLILNRDVINPNQLQSLIEVWGRFREYRRDMLLMMTPGPAHELLTVQPQIEVNPADYLRNLEVLVQPSGFFASSTLHHFAISRQQPGLEPILPVARIEQGLANPGAGQAGGGEGGQGQGGGRGGPRRVEMSGTVVLRADRMVGLLDREETQILLILRGDLRKPMPYVVEGVKGPNSLLGLTLFQEVAPARRLVGSVDTPAFRIEIEMDAELHEMRVEEARQPTPELVKELERAVARDMEERARNVIRKLQEDFRADAMGLGQAMVRHMATWPQWESYDWPGRFPEVPIEVDVTIHIRRGGMTFR